MREWGELVAAALVGTDRRPLPGADDSAVAVLEGAAAWGVYRRAGVPPVRGLPAPPPAPAEAHHVVGPAAAARFAGLLEAVWEGGFRMPLVAEWLAVAGARGRRVPPELLPELLDVGRRDADVRPLIVAAGGARAAWLAGQSPEWTYLTEIVDPSSARDESAWHEGTPGQRAGYLTARRRDDPDAGRALLAAEWPSLAPDERARLLGAMAAGLGPADEEFLEAALDDRRREVRAVAADLLAVLPGSAYNARMAARVRACFVRDPDGALRVRPPADCDPAMVRDGIAARPPAGTGARAWWLEQVLARAPLSDLPGLTPDLMASISTVDDWLPVVYRGLARAAVARRDHGWAPALLDRLRGRTDARDRHAAEALLAALAPDELARRAAAACSAEPSPEAVRRTDTLLAHVPAPWPDGLSAAVLGWIDRTARGSLGNRLHGACGLAAMRIPTAHADAAAGLAERLRAEAPQAPARYTVDRMAATLRLRHEMIRELT